MEPVSDASAQAPCRFTRNLMGWHFQQATCMPSCIAMSYNAGSCSRSSVGSTAGNVNSHYRPLLNYYLCRYIARLHLTHLCYAQLAAGLLLDGPLLFRNADKLPARTTIAFFHLSSCASLTLVVQRSAVICHTIGLCPRSSHRLHQPAICSLALSWESCWSDDIPDPHPASPPSSCLLWLPTSTCRKCWLLSSQAYPQSSWP